MIHALAAGSALIRHWKMAAIGLALLFAAASQMARLASERSLERCRGEAAAGRLRLELLQAAAERLRRDSARRSAEQAELVKQAKRRNAADEAQIIELERSAVTERAGTCPLSEALKRAEGGL